jgi:hypothetical protein
MQNAEKRRFLGQKTKKNTAFFAVRNTPKTQKNTENSPKIYYGFPGFRLFYYDKNETFRGYFHHAKPKESEEDMPLPICRA